MTSQKRTDLGADGLSVGLGLLGRHFDGDTADRGKSMMAPGDDVLVVGGRSGVLRSRSSLEIFLQVQFPPDQRAEFSLAGPVGARAQFQALKTPLFCDELGWRDYESGLVSERRISPQSKTQRIPNLSLSPPKHQSTPIPVTSRNKSVKMARRPARCYRYCKNKVSNLRDRITRPRKERVGRCQKRRKRRSVGSSGYGCGRAGIP